MWVLLIIESPVEKIQFFIKEFEKMRNRWIMCPFCKGTPVYKFYKWNPCCVISCFKAFIMAVDFIVFSILYTKLV